MQLDHKLSTPFIQSLNRIFNRDNYMTSFEEENKKNYKGKDPMSPEKITSHEPTAVKRESDTEIAEGGKTGTDTEEAKEKYRKKGMTEV